MTYSSWIFFPQVARKFLENHVFYMTIGVAAMVFCTRDNILNLNESQQIEAFISVNKISSVAILSDFGFGDKKRIRIEFEDAMQSKLEEPLDSFLQSRICNEEKGVDCPSIATGVALLEKNSIVAILFEDGKCWLRLAKDRESGYLIKKEPHCTPVYHEKYTKMISSSLYSYDEKGDP